MLWIALSSTDASTYFKSENGLDPNFAQVHLKGSKVESLNFKLLS